MRQRLMTVALATLVGTAAAQNQPWIDLEANRTTTFNSSSTRGLQCTAPIDFTVVGVEVPDPNNQGRQSVAVFRMTAKAPAFSASTMLTPDFAAIDVASGSIIPVSPPVTIQGSQGEWLGVLGACNTGPGATMNNVYAANSGVWMNGRIGGNTVPVYRFLTQSNLSTLGTTVVASSEDAGFVSNVHVYIVAHGVDNAAPNPGNTVTLTCEAGAEATSGQYICALSLGTGPIVLPFGSIGLSPDGLFLITAQNLIPTIFSNSQSLLDGNGEGQPQVNIPNIPALIGTSIYSTFITLPSLTIASTSSFKIS